MNQLTTILSPSELADPMQNRSVDTLRPLRIAFLTPSNPIDADTGGKQFTLDRLLLLSQLAEVDVFCLEDTPDQRTRLSNRLGGRAVFSAGVLKPRTAWGWLASIMRGLPLSVWRNDVADLSTLISRHVNTRFDAVYVDHWLMWPVSRLFHPKAARLLNLHNAEHRIFERAAKNHTGPLRLILKVEAYRTRRYLRKIGGLADAVHTISEADKIELTSIGIPAPHITAILPCVAASTSPIIRQPVSRVLFAGTLSWHPNAEGLEWFLRYVLPKLDLDAPVQVIGGDPPSAWLNLPAARKVAFLGRVSSIEPFYESAAVMIAPVFSGSGIKLKIVNSLAHGLPVVTTTCGIEGFPPGWEGAVQVCDDPEKFGRCVREFIEDTKLQNDAGIIAKRYVARHFSAEAARIKLEESLNAIARH